MASKSAVRRWKQKWSYNEWVYRWQLGAESIARKRCRNDACLITGGIRDLKLPDALACDWSVYVKTWISKSIPKWLSLIESRRQRTHCLAQGCCPDRLYSCLMDRHINNLPFLQEHRRGRSSPSGLTYPTVLEKFPERRRQCQFTADFIL